MRVANYNSLLTMVVGMFVFTMFSTQAEATELRAWAYKFNSGHARFKVLHEFNDEAVLDRETRLVWQRSPGGITIWGNARFLCAGANTGGRYGWRLPSLSELSSLLDATAFSPALTPGHPFLGVSNSIHFTATVRVDAASVEPWGLDVTQGQVHFGVNPNDNHAYWCVRGPIAGPSAY